MLRLVQAELLAGAGGRVPCLVAAKRPVPGIDDMADFYRQLVAQHAAVSYGDDLFSLAVLIPTGSGNAQLRDILWLDNQDALRAFKLTPDQLAAVGLSIEAFRDSREEASADRIRAYAGAVISGRIVAKRNPVLFSIAKENVLWALQSGICDLQRAVYPFLDQLSSLGIQ